MNDMTWITRLLECDGAVNEPASAAELASLAALIGSDLPDEVASLYAGHDGSSARLSVGGTPLPVRLMPVVEVTETAHTLWDLAPTFGEVLWIWYDENSNYAGVYWAGPLRGMVAVLDHEEPDVSPRFRSTESFVLRMLDACTATARPPVDAIMIPNELPITDGVDCCASDSDIAELFLERFRASTDSDERLHLAYVALRLLPPNDMSRVVPLLRDEDMWIAARAVDLVALRRWEPGLPYLGELAEGGLPNAQSAAARCLHRWKHSAAAAAERKRLEGCLSGRAKQNWEMWKR